MPKVSVVIPVYNAERFLKETLQSVLNQTFQDFEILLIDDGSTDGSLKIAEAFQDKRIRIFCNEKNLGIAQARNRGIANAESEYIALLDHDDIALPFRLEHEVDYLDQNPSIMVVGGHQREINEEGKDLNKQWNGYLNPMYIKAYLMFNNPMINGSTLFRKLFVEQNQIFYQDNLYGAEDYMFWVECSLKGKIKNLDEVFLLWRRSKGQETTIRKKKSQYERNKALSKIRETAIKGNGIALEKWEYEIIHRVFEEEGLLQNITEIEMLYQILKNIAEQAVYKKLENAEEIKSMCRKRFGEKIGKAFFLW